MYTVYVLRDSRGKMYKGVTSDLDQRLKGHKSGNTRTTRNMIDISVVYTENFEDFDTTRKKEVYLKTAAGRRFLKGKIAQ